MDFLEAFIGDVCVDLCGGDGRMSEHGLHRTDIGSIDEKVSSKAMTQGVWVDIFDDARFARVVFDETLDTARSEALTFSCGVFFVHQSCFSEGYEERRIDISASGHVRLEGCLGSW